MKICNNCHKENDSGNKYCQFCGSPLFRLCKKCGAEMDLDSTFCTKCGFDNSPESITILEKTKNKKKKKIKKVLIICSAIVLIIIGLKVFTIIKTNKELLEPTPWPVLFYDKHDKFYGGPSFHVAYLYPSIEKRKYRINEYSLTRDFSSNNSTITKLIEDALKTGYLNACFYYDQNRLVKTRHTIESDEFFNKKIFNLVYSSNVKKIKYKWPWNWKDCLIELDNGIILNSSLISFEIQDYDTFKSTIDANELKMDGLTDPYRREISYFIPENKEGFYFPPCNSYSHKSLWSYDFTSPENFIYFEFYNNIDDALHKKETGLWYWDYVLLFGYFDKQIVQDSNGNRINDELYDYWQVEIPLSNKTFIYKFKKGHKYPTTSSQGNSIAPMKNYTPYFNKAPIIAGSTISITGFDGDFSEISKYILSNGETISSKLFFEFQNLNSVIPSDSNRINFAETLTKYNIQNINIDKTADRIWIHGINNNYDIALSMYIGYIPSSNFSYIRGVFRLVDVLNEDSKIESITFISNDDEYNLNMEDIDQEVLLLPSWLSDEISHYITIDFLVDNDLDYFRNMVKNSEASIRIKVDDELKLIKLDKEILSYLEEIINLQDEYLALL